MFVAWTSSRFSLLPLIAPFHALIRFRRLRRIRRLIYVRIFFAQLSGNRASYGQRLRINSGRNSARRQRRQYSFGGNVADQLIAGERTATHPGERAVESAASCLIRGQNLFRRAIRPAVQMHPDLNARDAILHGAIKLRHFLR
jgi:hypothetical protein